MRNFTLGYWWPPLAITVITLLIFWPGVSGPFLLDDGANLAGLGQYGPINSFESLRAYMFSVSSGSLGRPLSVASFAFDAQTWPAAAESFKRSNIMLHAFNGILLYILLTKLCRIAQLPAPQARIIAIGATLLWLLHPLQTSTVLYVVQRMAELSATFVFLGVIGYLHGRSLINRHPTRAYIWMSASLLVCTPLAALSKENGLLLPFYIITLELTVLAFLSRPPSWRYWAGLFLLLPLIAAPIYLVSHWNEILASYQLRPFDLGERVLTQTRILVQQLFYSVVPPTHTPTLIYDDIQKSSGLFTPISTALSTLLLTTLIAAALMLRKRAPYASFAILWFLAAHAMESSVIALELFFEHRNYVAFVGPIFALSYYLSRPINQHQHIVMAVFAVLIVYSAVLSYQNNTIWGDKEQLIETWAVEKTHSIQAQQQSALSLVNQGQIQDAIARLERVRALAPEHLGSHVMLVNLRCLNQTLKPDELFSVFDAAASAKFDTALNNSLSRLSHDIRNARCQLVTPKGLHELYRHIATNEHINKRAPLIANIFYDIAEYHISQRQLSPAIRALERAHKAIPKLDFSLRQATILVSAGRYDKAQQALTRAYLLDEKRRRFAPSRKKELDIVQQAIDNAQKPATP